MARVTGPLKTISDNASAVLEVNVRATRLRPSGSGLTTTESEPATWSQTTGQVTFTAEPGDAVITLVFPGWEETIPIVVPEKTTATLREVAESAIQYPPPVVTAGVQEIRDAHAQALAEVAAAHAAALADVQAAVAAAVTAQMGTKADKTQVDQLAGQVMVNLGLASGALARVKKTS